MPEKAGSKTTVGAETHVTPEKPCRRQAVSKGRTAAAAAVLGSWLLLAAVHPVQIRPGVYFRARTAAQAHDAHAAQAVEAKHRQALHGQARPPPPYLQAMEVEIPGRLL